MPYTTIGITLMLKGTRPGPPKEIAAKAYINGDWAIHPRWRPPTNTRSLGATVIGWDITHVPTSRWVAWSEHYFDAVRALDVLAGIPFAYRLPVDPQQPPPAGAVDPAYLERLAAGLGNLRLYFYRGQWGERLTLPQFLDWMAQRERQAKAAKGTHRGSEKSKINQR